MTDQQKALVLEEAKGPYTVVSRPIPKATAGHLVVKVHAAALNPVDHKIKTYGSFPGLQYPLVLGQDISGEVFELGEGVTGFEKGDRVFCQGFYNNDRAGFQQYTTIVASLAAKIPERLSYSQAATLPVATGTAFFPLYSPKPDGAGLESPLDLNPKYSGKPALVIGGSASVGQLAIQFLRISGFSPIIAYASAKHTDFLKSLGATHVIDRNATPFPALTAAVKNISSAQFDIVYDAVGQPDSQQTGYDILANGGHLAVVLPVAVKKVEGDEKSVTFARGSVHFPANDALGKALYANITKLLEDGVIVPNRNEDLKGGLKGIAEGLERFEKGDVSGVKLVGHPQE